MRKEITLIGLRTIVLLTAGMNAFTSITDAIVRKEIELKRLVKK